MTEPKVIYLSQMTLEQFKPWLHVKFPYGALLRPDETGHLAVYYWGMSPSEAARLLYAMADEVVEQKIPLPSMRKQ